MKISLEGQDIEIVVAILVTVVLLLICRYSLKANTHYYENIRPIAENKIMIAINIIEAKQATKEVKNEYRRLK